MGLLGGYDRKNRAAAVVIHSLYTACPALAHTFIHNMLWCHEAADTNSSFSLGHVNTDSACLFNFFYGPGNLKQNQGFCPAACLKIEQGNGWMRVAAENRPMRPMDASKFSLLASANTACGAQTLLNLYAIRRFGRPANPDDRSARESGAGICPSRCEDLTAAACPPARRAPAGGWRPAPTTRARTGCWSRASGRFRPWPAARTAHPG